MGYFLFFNEYLYCYDYYYFIYYYYFVKTMWQVESWKKRALPLRQP